MDAVHANAIRPGMAVQAADDGDLGRIVEAHPSYFVVEKGALFPESHEIPVSAVASVDDAGTVRLNVTKEEAVARSWREPAGSPVEGTSPGMADESYDPTYGPQGELSPAGREAVGKATGADAAEVGASDDTAGRQGGGEGTAGSQVGQEADASHGTGLLGAWAHAAAPAATAGIAGTTDAAASAAVAGMPGFTGETAIDAAGMESSVAEGEPSAVVEPVTDGATTIGVADAAGVLRIPLHAEELIAIKTQIPLGAVRIEKEIVTEERTFTVPVTKERLRITRLAPSDGAGPDDPFAEDVIEIPIREETVEIVKRPRVVSEVQFEKEQVERTERLSGTVRREEIWVDETARPVDDLPAAETEDRDARA